MFRHQTQEIARVIHVERQADIGRRLFLRTDRPAVTIHRSVRQRFGRGLVRVGLVIASDVPLQLSARR